MSGPPSTDFVRPPSNTLVDDEIDASQAFLCSLVSEFRVLGTREREFITNAILYNVYRGREEGYAWAKAARPDLTAPDLDSLDSSGLDISGLMLMALNATPVPTSRDHLHVVDGIWQWLSSPDESPLFPYRGWDNSWEGIQKDWALGDKFL